MKLALYAMARKGAQKRTTMAFGSFLDKAKKAAEKAQKAAAAAAAEAQKRAAKAAEEAARQTQNLASKMADKAAEASEEAKKTIAETASQLQDGTIIDNAKKAAGEAAQQVQEVASKVADKAADVTGDARKTISETSAQLQDKASDIWDSIDTEKMAADLKKKIDNMSNAAGQAYDNAAEDVLSFMDRFAETIRNQIRKMLRGLNLQEIIDKVREVGKEKNINVAPLVDFIQKLKEF